MNERQPSTLARGNAGMSQTVPSSGGSAPPAAAPAAPGDAATGCQPSRELLTAWLLLLLGRQATHGYELRRTLEARGLLADPAGMYRVLRKLEDEGRAASFWGQSVAGPPRRLYKLTAKGLRDLNELAGAIRLTRDFHAEFLQAHEAYRGGTRASA